MNKTKISKIIVLLIIAITLIICTSTRVLADEPIDLSGSLTGTSSSENNTNDEDETPSEETNQNSKDETSSGSTNQGSKEETTSEKKEDIPYAGSTESILLPAAFISFAIIGVYTFIKLSNYSNI